MSSDNGTGLAIPVGEVTFALPAQKFTISCAVSTQETLPVVTEFVIRLLHVCGTIRPAQIQSFFGFSESEVAAVIRTLADERLVQWAEDELELTSYALERFLDSSDSVPRCFAIQDWTTSVVFELIGFTPARGGTGPGSTRVMVELSAPDPERQSKTILWAERAFEEHFRTIWATQGGPRTSRDAGREKERPEIYKISSIEAGRRFLIDLPCTFSLVVDERPELRRSIDDVLLRERLEVAQAISDALASGHPTGNAFFGEFAKTFGDEVLASFMSNEGFDLQSYIHRVHIERQTGYPDGVRPIVGNLYLRDNRKALLDALRAVCPTGTADSAEGTQACWLVPDVAFWGRSRRVRSMVNEANKILLMRGDEQSEQNELNDEAEETKHGTSVLFPSSRVVDGRSIGAYRDSFPNAFSTNGACLGSKVEIFLVPKRVVCALFHYHIDHPIAVPIGFISTLPEHLASARQLIYESSIHGHEIKPMGGRDQEKKTGSAAFAFLAPEAT